MSKFSLRKDNVGSAIIRFMVGVLILAIVVWLLYEFVLNGEFDLKGKKPDGVQPLATTDLSVNPIVDEEPYAPAVTDEPTWKPGEPIGMTREPMPTAEPAATPTATPAPTAEPTATPTPAPTPIPEEMFSQRYRELESVGKWGIKKDRIENGLTRFEIPLVNGGKVISLTGWGYVNDKHFDGEHCKTYIMILDTKKNVRLYETTTVEGATGMTHEGLGKNLEKCDFTALISVADFADGDYQIGVGMAYTYGNQINRLAYTFGDAYNFTVASGVITAVNGIEQ